MMSNNARRYQKTKGNGETNNRRNPPTKFAGQEPNEVVHPKTENQAKALRYMEDKKALILLTGSAGTGKSYLAAYYASKLLKGKYIDKVYLVRPYVTTGKTVGLLPGTIREKLAPSLAPILSHFEKFLGKAMLEEEQEGKWKHIEIQALEFIRGNSFENCVVICEELQNATPEEIKALVTRIGEGCQVIVTADPAQHDLKGQSGITYLLDLVKRVRWERPGFLNDDEIDQFNKNIGVVEFTQHDIVRSGLVRSFVKCFNEGY